MGNVKEIVKVELTRLITGSLDLGKLENINAVQDEDVCGTNQFLVTIKGSANGNRMSFTVSSDEVISLLNTSIKAFIHSCKAKGLSVRREFQELYPALVS